MARPKVPAALRASGTTQAVSGNRRPAVVKASAQVFKPDTRPADRRDDRNQIAQPWQREAYRHVNICGAARYAVTLFASLAARAEIGISEPQTLGRKAVWVNAGPEVEVLAELAPTVRDRTRLVRDYMLHRSIAGECYLIARARRETDPEYDTKRTEPIWEIVAVTELRRIGNGVWEVRMDNENWVPLAPNDPVIRLWNPDPENRREAWSPMRSLLPDLREIEWLTGHIFTQVRSRLMSAGVWFLPNNLTYPPPPPESVVGGAEAIAQMNESELFMASLAASGSYELDLNEVSFPTVVMADPAALNSIDKDKLIKFWSEIDDKAMTLRSDAIRRFALGWDLPPEQVLGSSGVAVSGSSGSAGSVNHWGEWANEEKTIAGHIEPALNDFVEVLTVAVVRAAVDGTDKVVAYDPTSIRMKQDRSKEAILLNQQGLLSGRTTVREVGFDPENDMMDEAEFRRWLLTKVAGGSATPEQVNESLRLLGVVLNVPVSGNDGSGNGSDGAAPAQPGRNLPRNTDDVRQIGPPQGQRDHSDAPYTALVASCEVLVLRALEKAGNRLLNDGRRGKDRDRTTPLHLAHLAVDVVYTPDFDFTLLPTALVGYSAAQQARIGGALKRFCAGLYDNVEPYSREALIAALADVEGL